MLFAIAGLCTAFNLVIIHLKCKVGRYLDAVLDVAAFFFLVWLFKDSGQGGIVIGMIASFLVSIYLFFAHKPPPTKEQVEAKVQKQKEQEEKERMEREEDKPFAVLSEPIIVLGIIGFIFAMLR
ncbi:hypothetical protein FACS189487_00370 [Campylobacterota bacterium]|nr:hypothetical protein FACS189487_00370 [Campylobacterota bacterium]